MPKFPSTFEIYRCLQRELPGSVYPDGAPSGYFSTADNWAFADVMATGYANAKVIYDNYWIQNADERLTDWEITVFAKNLAAALTIAERRDRILTQIRSRKGLTKQDMIDTVLAIIGTDKWVDAIEWGCGGAGDRGGAWVIGVSLLGLDTYLGGIASIQSAWGPGLCSAVPADFGLTQAEWDSIREQAYTYEILIYDYTPTANELIEIDEQLSKNEPARSQHKISSAVEPPTVDGGFEDSDQLLELDGGEGEDPNFGDVIDGGGP